MKNQSIKIDLSNDLLLLRHQNGVVLIRPEMARIHNLKLYSIEKILSMPYNVYFMSPDSYFYQLNESTADSLGFVSIEDGIGKSVRETAKNETREKILSHDKILIEKDQSIFEEIMFNRKSDDISKPYLLIKFPLYDYKNNKLLGIFGVAISLDPTQTNSISTSLTTLTDTGLLGPSSSKNILTPFQVDNTTFTFREKDVMHYLVLGKSAKEIAFILGISPRTVEEYIANIKVKLNVSSKSAVIEKVIPLFREI